MAFYRIFFIIAGKLAANHHVSQRKRTQYVLNLSRIKKISIDRYSCENEQIREFFFYIYPAQKAIVTKYVYSGVRTWKKSFFCHLHPSKNVNLVILSNFEQVVVYSGLSVLRICYSYSNIEHEHEYKHEKDMDIHGHGLGHGLGHEHEHEQLQGNGRGHGYGHRRGQGPDEDTDKDKDINKNTDTGGHGHR